jgi:hypothetical protein
MLEADALSQFVEDRDHSRLSSFIPQSFWLSLPYRPRDFDSRHTGEISSFPALIALPL